MTGIVSAYMLAKSGLRVAVLESGRICEGATAYTTAFLMQSIDTDLGKLIKLFGADAAKRVWESGAAAIDEIEDIAAREGIGCEFQRCPARIYSTTDGEFKELEAQEKRAGELGLNTFLKRDGALNFKNTGYWEIPDQAKCHPLKFVHSLAAKAAGLGVAMFERSEVKRLVGGERIEAHTAKAKVTAKYSIVATEMPFNNPKITHYKKAMYKTYVLEAKISKGSLKEGLYTDLMNPYHYFRVDSQEGFDRLIIGGEDHRMDIPIGEEHNYRALEGFLRALLPGAEYKVVRRWSGGILESTDGLPYIGEYAPNQFLAAAYSGNGMTYSMVAAMLFRDLIAGKPSGLTRIYDPKRPQAFRHFLIKAPDYVAEFFGGAFKNMFK